MSPPKTPPMDDPTTGELRFLDAASECRAAQATLQADMAEIRAALVRLEQHATTIATMAAGLNKIGAWLTGWTWKGGVVVLVAALSPWVVGIGGTLLLAGQAPAISTMIHGVPATTYVQPVPVKP